MSNKVLKRLRNIKQKKSTVDLAAKSIAKNLDFYLTHETELKIMPCQLRKKVLLEVTKLKCSNKEGDALAFEQIIKFVTLLLDSDTQSLKIKGLMTFCPSYSREQNCTEILQLVGRHAPNLESLTINEESEDSGVEIDTPISEETLQAIGKMTKLKKLVDHRHYIKYEELMQICKKLPSLRHVDVRIIFNAPNFNDLDSFKNSFFNLRTLQFTAYPDVVSSMSCGTFVDTLWRLTLQHLPYLVISHQYADTTCWREP